MKKYCHPDLVYNFLHKGCFTLDGTQCILPFKYFNVSEAGVVTELTYTKCTTIDIYKPWCPTLIDPLNDDILEWGLCQESCPQEIADIVCLEEPPFPEFVTQEEAAMLFVNFSANYDYGSEKIMDEMTVIEYACPPGHHFEDSFNVTQYALCHNWEWTADFDRDARCQRKQLMN